MPDDPRACGGFLTSGNLPRYACSTTTADCGLNATIIAIPTTRAAGSAYAAATAPTFESTFSDIGEFSPIDIVEFSTISDGLPTVRFARFAA